MTDLSKKKSGVAFSSSKKLVSMFWCTASSNATTWWNTSASSSKVSCSAKTDGVQSYGSRCVKPPIIYGDVFRPRAMTVRWSKFAQSVTKHAVKGMLTGPVTILQWSFVARRSAPLGDLQANCTGHPRRGCRSRGGRDQGDPN